MFNLQPGEQVLLRQFVPGKGLSKATGPHTYLRAVNKSGAEIMTQKGKVIRAALVNLKPYRAPVTGEVKVVQRSPALFDSSEDESSVSSGSE